jgi:hypothetical protein
MGVIHDPDRSIIINLSDLIAMVRCQYETIDAWGRDTRIYIR